MAQNIYVDALDDRLKAIVVASGSCDVLPSHVAAHQVYKLVN